MLGAACWVLGTGCWVLGAGGLASRMGQKEHLSSNLNDALHEIVHGELPELRWINLFV